MICVVGCITCEIITHVIFELACYYGVIVVFMMIVRIVLVKVVALITLDLLPVDSHYTDIVTG